MKKILVVNDFPIFPVVHGGKVRIFNIYKNISSKFHVTYLCLGDNKKIQDTRISEHFHEIAVPKTVLYKIIVLMANIMMGRSVDDFVALFFAHSHFELKKIIRKEIEESDIIIFCHPYMYPAVSPYIQKQIVIYEALNVEYSLKNSILPTGFLKNIMLHRLKKICQNLLNRCDLCFTMSEADKQIFSRLYSVDNSKIRISPNGVDLDFYSEVYLARTTRHDPVVPVPLILFLGSGHPPNVEAAFQIIRNIAPKLPNVYFLIAGSVCWMIRNESRGKNVGLAYFISDDEKRELFRVANIALNPMVSGSGTNLKMLDYMAAGLPVISTAVGARGITIQNHKHAIICDLNAFADEISHLIDHADIAEELSRNGRRLVKEHYDWKNIANSMICEIEEISAEKGF
jgi:glycosyltransferase involved in cell wall biosynthesis